MSVEFLGMAELLMNSAPVPWIRLSASPPRRISSSWLTVSKVSRTDDFNLAMLNVRGLRDSSKCARLLAELKILSVDVAAVQETHFICAADSHVLENDFNVFSAYGSRSSAGVSLLVGHSLDADVDIVFAGDGGWLVVADVALKVSSSGWLRFMRPISLWRGFPFFVSWRHSWMIRSG